jgi:hypothetical protein
MEGLLVLAGVVILIVGAYVWYKVAQKKNEQAFRERLEQMPESERAAYINQKELKKNWGCLSAFLALALIGNTVLAFISFFSGNSDMYFGGFLNILGAVFAGVIYWKKKRWAVYGYGTLVVVVALINLATLGVGALLQGLVPVVFLSAAVRPVWDQLD